MRNYDNLLYLRVVKFWLFGFWEFIGYVIKLLILFILKEIGLIEVSIYIMCLLNKCICWLYKIFVDREIFVNIIS